MGYKILINKKDEDDILDILGINRDELALTIKNSEYFKKFGELKLIDQLIFAIPLIISIFV